MKTNFKIQLATVCSVPDAEGKLPEKPRNYFMGDWGKHDKAQVFLRRSDCGRNENQWDLFFKHMNFEMVKNVLRHPSRALSTQYSILYKDDVRGKELAQNCFVLDETTITKLDKKAKPKKTLAERFSARFPDIAEGAAELFQRVDREEGEGSDEEDDAEGGSPEKSAAAAATLDWEPTAAAAAVSPAPAGKKGGPAPPAPLPEEASPAPPAPPAPPRRNTPRTPSILQQIQRTPPTLLMPRGRAAAAGGGKARSGLFGDDDDEEEEGGYSPPPPPPIARRGLFRGEPEEDGSSAPPPAGPGFAAQPPMGGLAAQPPMGGLAAQPPPMGGLAAMLAAKRGRPKKGEQPRQPPAKKSKGGKSQKKKVAPPAPPSAEPPAPSLALAQMVVRRVAPRPGAASGGVVVTKAPAPAAGAPDAGLLPPPPLYEALFREFLSVSNVYVRGKLFASGMRALALALTLLFCLPRPHRRPQHSRGHPRAHLPRGVPEQGARRLLHDEAGAGAGPPLPCQGGKRIQPGALHPRAAPPRAPPRVGRGEPPRDFEGRGAEHGRGQDRLPCEQGGQGRPRGRLPLPRRDPGPGGRLLAVQAGRRAAEVSLLRHQDFCDCFDPFVEFE